MNRNGKLILFCVSLTLLGLIHSSCTMYGLHKKHATEIGAIAESSARLSKIITRLVPRDGLPKRVLEVGAGTGVFTKKLVKKLNPGDHLDVVELMPELCSILHKEFDEVPNVTVHCADILKFKASEPFDYIVSGLPFNSFSADLIIQITNHLVKLAKPGALCSFFEYKWMQSFRGITLSGDEKKAFQAKRNAIESFIKRYEISSASVYLNIPPAIVHFLKIEK